MESPSAAETAAGAAAPACAILRRKGQKNREAVKNREAESAHALLCLPVFPGKAGRKPVRKSQAGQNSRKVLLKGKAGNNYQPGTVRGY